MSVITDDYIPPEPESVLTPGEALLNCNGQDIVKKGASKGRNRILTIMPMHLAMPAKASDATLGAIRNLNSDQPELVVPSADGDYVFKGRFEAPSTKFLAIACQPSTGKKTGQSTMTDVFDRILVFSKPVLVPRKAQSQEVVDQAEQLPGVYSANHGTSAVADPIRAATAKRLGGSPSAAISRTSSATKGLGRSMSLNSVGRSQASSKGSVSKARRRYASDESTNDRSGIGDSSSDSEHNAIVVDADSASDIAEELRAAGGRDSPVLVRTSSRRASATKPVSYKESDDEEEDERSYSSTSSSGSSSGSDSSRSDSARSEVDDARAAKGAGKGRTPTTKSSRGAKGPATNSSMKPRASATKAPVARKLAAPQSAAKGKAGKKQSGYFSESSDSDGAGGEGDSGSERSSPFTSDTEGGSGEGDSEDEYEEPVSGSKKRKPSASSKAASPMKKGPKKPPAKSPTAKPAKAARSSSGAGSASKPKASAATGSASQGTTAAASAAKRPTRAALKGKRVISLDSDSDRAGDSSSSGGGGSDSDEDYED